MHPRRVRHDRLRGVRPGHLHLDDHLDDDVYADDVAATAEQREKARLEAEAAKTTAAEQATVDQARKDIERAQTLVEQAQKQAQTQGQQEATKEVAKEVARVQEALKEAQRELELYAKGTAALDMARYEKALEAFAEAAALKGRRPTAPSTGRRSPSTRSQAHAGRARVAQADAEELSRQPLA